MDFWLNTKVEAGTENGAPARPTRIISPSLARRSAMGISSWSADTVLRITSQVPAAAFNDASSLVSTKLVAPSFLHMASLDALVEMAVTSQKGLPIVLFQLNWSTFER